MSDVRVVIGADGRGATSEIERVKKSLTTLPGASRAAQSGLDGLGMSAAQTAQAMRQVPMQVTDMVTSLASGMPVYMVAIQQGGQLKDAFGGIVPAAKALTSTLVGMINPITLAGAAAAAVGAAWYQSEQAAAAFSKALILSGNAIGMTTGQLQQMASTQGLAASALAEMAGSSNIAARDLANFTAVALEWERATGQAVSATRKQFEELSKSPVDALVKLNEGTNFLTVAVLEQVVSLKAQGKETEAAEVAQRAWASALKTRAEDVQESTNKMARAWSALASQARAAWSEMVRAFDDDTPAQALTKLDQQIATLEGKIKNRPNRIGGLLGQWLGDDPAQLAGLKAQRDSMAETIRLSERAQVVAAQGAAVERKAVAEKVKAIKEEEEARKKAASDARKDAAAALKAAEDQRKAESAMQELIAKAQDRDAERINAENAASGLKLWEDQNAARLASAAAANKQGAAFGDLVVAIQTETQLLQMSASERELSVEMMKLEALGVERGTDAWNAYAEALRGAIGDRAQARAGVESAKAFEDEWTRTSDRIGQSLSDALMNGGKSGADYLKGLIRSAFAKPIQVFFQPVTGAISSLMMGSSPASAASGGGIGVGSIPGLGSMAGSAALWAGSALGTGTALGGFATGMGTALSSGAGTAATWAAGSSLAAVPGGGAAGAGMMAGAALPWVAGALVVASLLMKKGGGPKTVGRFASDADTAALFGDRWTTDFGDTGALAGSASETVAELQKQINAAAKGLGGQGGLSLPVAMVFDMDPKGKAQNQVRAAIGDTEFYGQFGRSESELQAGVAETVQRMILAGLQQSELPTRIADTLNATNASTASLEQVQAALAAAQSMHQLGEALKLIGVPLDSIRDAAIEAAGGAQSLAEITRAYYDATRSESEKLADATQSTRAAFEALGVRMPESVQGLRAVVEQLQASSRGASDEGQTLAVQLMALAPAMAALEQSVEGVVASIGAMTSGAAGALTEAGGWPTADDWVKYAQAIGDPETLANTLQRSFSEAWERLDLGEAFPAPKNLAEYQSVIAGLDVSARESLVWAEKLDGALNLAPEFSSLVQALDGTAAGVEQTVNRITQSINTLSNLQSLYSETEYKAMMAPLLQQQFASIITDGTAMPTNAAAMRAVVESITDPDVKANLAAFVGTWDDFYVSVEKVSTAARGAARNVDSAADAMRTAMKGVAEYVQGLFASDLSIGSPREQLEHAGEMYASTYRSALAGDAESMQSITRYADQYLRMNQDYYGATGGYVEVFERIVQELRALSGARGASSDGASSRGADLGRAQLAEQRQLRRVSERQLRVSQRAASRPSYAY